MSLDRTDLDRIEVRGLRARGRHGALPAERELGQEFVVDVSLGLDTRPAAETDDLSRTVDYGTLAGRLVAAVEADPVDLIETLADRLAKICLEDPAVAEAEVTVHKPSAPVPHPFTDVAVKIRRSRP
ncbi:dihydroneopterin aldolase [Actinomadura sp. NTSP31]|uniref:dihydroneopterin aldolase n=1 Tax=Actinomadura sp. NTSP31 TaxID=1735447 RepID=UPI0035BF60B7